MSFDWSLTPKYRKSGGDWPPGWPDDTAVYFSPTDGEGIHQLLLDLVEAAEHSIVINMYGFDDEDVNQALLKRSQSDHVYFQMSLDKTQAGGKTEKELLAEWDTGAIGTSIAVGQSVKHAISHLKVMIVDGLYVVSGSTNWSMGGEQKQDNELHLRRAPIIAAIYRSILDINHSEMLRQMAAAR